MDVARGVLIQWHRFQQNELSSLCGRFYINKLEEVVFALEDIGVALLANLTFEFLPVVAGHVLSVLLRVALGADPALQALEVDQTD